MRSRSTRSARTRSPAPRSWRSRDRPSDRAARSRATSAGVPSSTTVIAGGMVPPAAGALLGASWLILGLAVLASLRAIRPLREVLEGEPGTSTAPDLSTTPKAPRADRPLPTLSVVVTARDEAGRIARTVRGLLAQRYPDLEVVVVDDRSADGTSEILDELAVNPAGNAAGRLRVVRVEALPEGWLGKVHACRRGAERARGDWILFMDGDVELLRGDTLARVVRLAGRDRLDHVAVIPDSRPMSPLHAGLMAVFGQMYLTATRAFEMERDRPRCGGGIGAFNLVRRSAYERIGGHDLLRMEIADDFKLGRLLKESGARQRFYDGRDLVRCRWQEGTLEVIRGLEKNFFAGFDYSLWQVAAFTLIALALTFGPAILALAGSSIQGTAGRSSPAAAAAPWALLALLHPIAVLLLLGAAWNSTLRTLRRGGVRWRGTFYPIDLLRRGIVPRGAGRRAAESPGPAPPGPA